MRKSVVITGASKGIGRAVADPLAEQGWSVIGVARSAVHHEPWCMTLNTEIFYAYKIAVDPTALTVGDALILHSLSAAWAMQGGQGDCTQQ